MINKKFKIFILAFFILMLIGLAQSCNIYTCQDLQDMRNALNEDYALCNDINCNGFDFGDGKGFNPIGNYDASEPEYAFTGNFDGQNQTIINLHINRPDESYVGLFGHASNAEIKNIKLINAHITGKNQVGALVGAGLYCNISNSYSGGEISGDKCHGGGVGGLVGSSWYCNISSSYSSCSLDSYRNLGGLVGSNYFGNINNSYAAGCVTGNDNPVGGLVGWNNYGSIFNSYSIGCVNGTGNYIGGLVGRNQGICNNCFYDFETSGQLTSPCGVGKSTSEMQLISTFTDWDFNNIWEMHAGCYAHLKWSDDICPGACTCSKEVMQIKPQTIGEAKTPKTPEVYKDIEEVVKAVHDLGISKKVAKLNTLSIK